MHGIGIVRIPDAATVAYARRVGVGFGESATPTAVESEVARSAPPLTAGVLVPPVQTCPHCSHAVNGTCVLCGPDEIHPACEHCQQGQYRPPWYKHELAIAVYTSVLVTLAAHVVLSQLRARTKLLK